MFNTKKPLPRRLSVYTAQFLLSIPIGLVLYYTGLLVDCLNCFCSNSLLKLCTGFTLNAYFISNKNSSGYKFIYQTKATKEKKLIINTFFRKSIDDARDDVLKMAAQKKEEIETLKK